MENNDSNDDEADNFSKIFKVKNIEKDKNKIKSEILKEFEKNELAEEKIFPIIENVLNLNRFTVDEIMTHRIDLEAVEKNSTVQNVLNVYFKTKNREILVYENDIDRIIGVLYLDEILRCFLEHNDKNEKIEKYIKKLMFVPETMKCLNLLEHFKKEEKNIAVVVDEYGGTAGVVSFKDVKDFIFKDFENLTSAKEKNMVELKDSTILLKGTTNLKEVGTYLNIPIRENENFDTIGGFLVNALGKIPEENEHPTIEYEGVKFKILSVDKQHIEKVQVLR